MLGWGASTRVGRESTVYDIRSLQALSMVDSIQALSIELSRHELNIYFDFDKNVNGRTIIAPPP